MGPAEPDSESEVYEAVAVAPAPAAVEPTELDFRAGEGHHLQHISDREMPEADDDNLSFPVAPLSKERAQSLEAISRLCEDKYKDLGRVAVRRSFSADNFIGIQRSNAILS